MEPFHCPAFHPLNMKKFLLILILMNGTVLIAQEIPAATLQLLHRLLEEDLVEEVSENTFEHWYDEVRELLRNPVYVNQTNPRIERLFLLSSFQQQMLRDYLRKYGRMQSVYELQYIPGFDREIREALAPLISMETTRSGNYKEKKSLRGKTLLRLKTRFPRAAGYRPRLEGETQIPPTYAGSPEKILLKQDFQLGDFALGYTGEKDAGESFFCHDNPQGFDLNSFSLSKYSPDSPLAIFLGDYHLRGGFGLTGWSTASMNNSSPARSYSPSTLRPYRSTDEYRFLRGAALSWTRANWGLDAFFSYKKPDGRTETDKEQVVTANLDAEGWHHTKSQIAKEKALKEIFTGGRLYLKSEKTRWGLQTHHYRLHPPLLKDSLPFGKPLPENPFTSFSTDFSYRSIYWDLQTEIALYRFRWPAIYLSLSLRPYPSHEVRFLYQYLHPEYWSPYARNPAGGTARSNSERFLLQWECQPGWGWSFYARAAGESNLLPEQNELYRQSRFRADIRAEKDILENWKAGFQYRYTEEISEDLTTVHKYRLHLRSVPAEGWQLNHRIEYSCSGERKEGFLMYHEIQYQMPVLPFTLSFRYAFFDCPDYATRIYAWERDVLYAFGSTAYYGNGYRWYSLIRWDINTQTACWFRLAQTVQPGEENLGSGQEEIRGNRKTDMTLQLLFRF